MTLEGFMKANGKKINDKAKDMNFLQTAIAIKEAIKRANLMEKVSTLGAMEKSMRVSSTRV